MYTPYICVTRATPTPGLPSSNTSHHLLRAANPTWGSVVDCIFPQATRFFVCFVLSCQDHFHPSAGLFHLSLTPHPSILRCSTVDRTNFHRDIEYITQTTQKKLVGADKRELLDIIPILEATVVPNIILPYIYTCSCIQTT